MKKKLGPFAIQKSKLADPVPISLPAAVPRGYVDNTLYPGLLTRAAVDQDLLLDIPAWLPVPSPADPATRDNYIDDTGNFESGYIGQDVHRTAGPYVARIAEIELTEGTHSYSYKVTNTFGTNISGSNTVTFIVDRTGPYQTAGIAPRPLSMPVGHSGPLDAKYFADNGNEARFPIPNYDAFDAQLGDTWELLEGPFGDVVASGPVFPDEVVVLTLDQAKKWEGARSLYYRLRDASGNPSILPSLGLSVVIAIMPAPVLQTPGVRLALSLTGVGDRLIDRMDAAAASGMDVIIPNYVPDRSKDNLYVRLTTLHGNQQVGPIPLGSTALPYNFPVDYPVLRILYGSSNGPIALTVEYAVERGGVFTWVLTAAVIELYLFAPGPVNPAEPDLNNPNLPAPVLTGPVSALPNALDPRDAQQDAPVAVTLWSAAPLPSAGPFTIELYYGGERVDSVAVDNTTANPGDVIPMHVPWPFISRQGNGVGIPLQYRIVTTTSINANYSLVQGIDVSANVITFQQPSVVGAITTPTGQVIIGCSAVPQPSDTLMVFVPPHPLITEGMVIPLEWMAFSDDAGLTPISAASDTFTHTVNSSEVVTGFRVAVRPGSTFIKPINAASLSAGSVRIKYLVPIAGPSPVSSIETLALVRTYLSGSTPTYCDGTTWA
ncbi:hypothetical protein C4J85_2204 [Pseudomonas sp. R4-34-07]|uniref:hypothetical protein n=1 Tax=Pseudomonas sp. R4-34-07 TaxID=658642 RepID=UPI000F57DBF2|nr:hypothetical protein [Pseudomonas sp. R4-34-07]AZF52689.1 hypothetical protein C4J85_2204 [Pseudomonas sp. R4-34-07]